MTDACARRHGPGRPLSVGGRAFQLSISLQSPSESESSRDWRARADRWRDPRLARRSREPRSPQSFARARALGRFHRRSSHTAEARDATTGSQGAFSALLVTRRRSLRCRYSVAVGPLGVAESDDTPQVRQHTAPVLDFARSSRSARDRRVKLPPSYVRARAADADHVVHARSLPSRCACVRTPSNRMRVGELLRRVRTSTSLLAFHAARERSRAAQVVPFRVLMTSRGVMSTRGSSPRSARLPARHERLQRDAARLPREDPRLLASRSATADHDLHHARADAEIQSASHSRASITLDVYSHVMPVQSHTSYALIRLRDPASLARESLNPSRKSPFSDPLWSMADRRRS